MLHRELCANQRIRERFAREGYIANQVSHPGAVAVLDDDVHDDGTVFLVMELLQGETLAQRARRSGGTLPLDEVLAIAAQVLDVLAAAHRRGIVHRDVKPDNIYLVENATVKLLDFGIARVRDAAEIGLDATRDGATLGTPGFMAPEQARGRSDQIDARSDLWSLGACLFTLLSGERVHRGVSANEVLIATATLAAPSLASVLPEARPAVCALVDRALQLDRDARFAAATQMQEALRAVWRELGFPNDPEAFRFALPGESPTTLPEVSVHEDPAVAALDSRAQERASSRPPAGPVQRE
jgi:serine/threonine-protein kinase